MWKKLAISVSILLLALVVADVLVGRKIVDGEYEGLHVPPFWNPEPKEVRYLERRLEAALAGKPMRRTFRGWTPRYGWINAPGKIDVDGEEYWINSLGARGQREVGVEPRAGTARLLCFGESFTYGNEVRDGEDWPTLLEAQEQRLEVLNFGVGAWGTDQALLRFREVAPTLEHDVAILGLMLENIGRNVNRSRALYQVGSNYWLVKPRFVLEEGVLELVPIPYANEVEYLQAGLAERLFDDLEEHEYWSRIEPVPSFSNLAKVRAAKANSTRRAFRALWRDPEGEPYRVTLALLEAFHREALDLGAREALVVVYYQTQDHAPVGTDDPIDPYWATLHHDLRERGIPFVDTFETIAQLRREGERGYLETHHDARANERIADLVRAYLAERLSELR